jgi:tol-pal system protein YbgF
MAKSPFLWILLLAMMTLSGCASVSSMLPGSKRESEEMRELRQRIVDLQKRATMAEVEVEHLRRLLAESGVSAAAESEEPHSMPPPLDAPVEIIEITEADDAGEVRDRIELPVQGDEVRLEVSDLEPVVVEEVRREPASKDPQPELPKPPDDTPVESGDVVAERVAMTPEAQALYDRGYTFFHQGRYLDAESAFQQFLSAFGNTELADNAQFWIGESRYARDDLAGALAAFQEVASRYPAGNKVPDSMLKSADCLRGLGDLESAVRTYRLVIEKYPSTAAAAVAEERLGESD